MIDYSVLEECNTFYIKFESKTNEKVNTLNVETLIYYWYQCWFSKNSYPTFEWITKNIIKVYVDITLINSKNYIEKDFLLFVEPQEHIENRRGLYQILKYGVENNSTYIEKINFNIEIYTSICKENKDVAKLISKEDLLKEVKLIVNGYLIDVFGFERLNMILNLHHKYKLLDTNIKQFMEEYEHYCNYYHNTI